MFSLTSLPSTTEILSTYTAFAASAMLARTVFNELLTITNQIIPQHFRDKILALIGGLLGNLSSQITLTIDEYSNGALSINEVYRASDTYLSTKITPSNESLKVSKTPRDKNISVTINKGEKIVDEFEGIRLVWEFLCTETTKSYYDFETCNQSTETSERKSFNLSFHKKFKDKVLNSYLPYVLDKAKGMNDEKKVLKLTSLGNSWSSVDFHHPSTFETLAMDERLKKEVIDDLERFVKRNEFYKRVGKAWKRGYLLYGPPGTGKSSLVAAMANYLKFNIYDLELTQLQSNSELRMLLVSTENRSILVIEDIDCSVELEDRRRGGYNESDCQLTLSGLLNFIDGLWSSCGDERIIVFTTNYKDKLDPALLRPGRMDMHIHMSYCTPCGFKTLACNYLQIKSHPLFGEIEEMIKAVEVTPAEVAEELMKSDEPDIALAGLVQFLQRKKGIKLSEQANIAQEVNKEVECEQGYGVKEGQKMRVKKNKSKKARRKGGKY